MNESPRTPTLQSTSNRKSTPSNNSGGHFTPCRQMGLSRKRKRPSISSPLHVKNDTESNSTPKRSVASKNPIELMKKRNLNVLTTDTNKAETTDSAALMLEIDGCKGRIQEKMKTINEFKKSIRVDKENDLQELILKWRNGCQEALNALLNSSPNVTDMSKLLNDLNIPPGLVSYDPETESFL